MKTKKCKVCIYDCKTGKMRIEEREMPVYEPTPPKPSPLETVLYHLCKLIDPQNDSVLDEYAKWFENEFGITYKPTMKFVTYSELKQEIDDAIGTFKKNITKNYSITLKYDDKAKYYTIDIGTAIANINLSGKICPAVKNPNCKLAKVALYVDGTEKYSKSSPSKEDETTGSIYNPCTDVNYNEVVLCNKEIKLELGFGSEVSAGTDNNHDASFDINLNINYIKL